MDNFAAVCHIMNGNVYLNCLDQKTRTAVALLWLVGVCLAFWFWGGKKKCFAPTCEESIETGCVFLPRSDLRNQPTVFTTDSFQVTPPFLQLAPVWGISPRHQNSGCHHTLTHILLLTHWWAFAAPLQGTIRGIGCPVRLTSRLPAHM